MQVGPDTSPGWVRVDTEPLSLCVKLLVLQEVVSHLEANGRSCQVKVVAAAENPAQESTVGPTETQEVAVASEEGGEWGPGWGGQT